MTAKNAKLRTKQAVRPAAPGMNVNQPKMVQQTMQQVATTAGHK
jgi:hypothetical protein